MDSKKYKILIAHYRPDIVSGAENSIADFVQLVDERFEIIMLVAGGGKLAEFYRKLGFKVWQKRVETPRRLFPGLHTVQSLQFANTLRTSGIDAVVCNTFASASRIATSAKYAGLPLAVYMRDYISKSLENTKLLRKADAVFCISKDIIQYLLDIFSPEKTYLTYNFINPEPYIKRARIHQESGKRLLPFPGEDPVVGLVGRITPYKQPDVFIRAIPYVLKEVPNARFVIIGAAQSKETYYENSLLKLANDLGVQPYIAFMGQRSDVIEITSEFAISCLVSSREPLGRVILEANLLRIPVVAANTGGAAEIVDGERTGLQFSPNSKSAEIDLAKQIIRLLKDNELRACLAGTAYEKVMSTFASIDHVHVQEELLEKLCLHQL